MLRSTTLRALTQPGPVVSRHAVIRPGPVSVYTSNYFRYYCGRTGPKQTSLLEKTAIALHLHRDKTEKEKEKKDEEIVDMRRGGAHWLRVGAAVSQLGVLGYLIWGYSWDLMEPIVYFTTATWILIRYAAFLRRNPTFPSRHNHIQRLLELQKKHDFDIERLLELQKKNDSQIQRLLELHKEKYSV